MPPIRVAVANDYEVIVRGVGALLEPDERIDVVVLAAGAPVADDVDVVLYDTFGVGEGHGEAAHKMVRHQHAGTVVVYTDNFSEALVHKALARGVGGYLSKSLSSETLAAAIVRIHEGERVVMSHDDGATAPPSERAWPGREHGLTEREANVLSLIVQGVDNDEIAERLFVSVNTVKSRIRTLYRKIGVTSRVQAAMWGVRNGFDPDHLIIWDE